MGQIIARHAIDNDFVKEVSTVAKYNQGLEVEIADSATGYTTTYKYIKASAALTANQPYVLVEKAEEIGTASPATSSVSKIIGIPQVAIASGSYGFVAIKGLCKAKTGIQAKGDTLEVINSGTTLIVDGTSGTPAETVGTVAISAEAAAAAATVNVVLLGKRVQIAAS